LRVIVDASDDKLGAKVRLAQLQKIPLMLVVGEKEASSGTVSVRKRTGGDQGSMGIEEFITWAGSVIQTRALTL
jgi:threonyl-tRNA synthetase